MSRPNSIAHRLYTGELSYDFVGKRNRWYLFSAILLTVCILGFLLRGLNLGIEFKGGSDFKAPVQVTATTVDEVRRAVVDLSLEAAKDVNVTTLGDNTVRVQTASLGVDEVPKVKAAIAKTLNIKTDDVAYSLIGASWGEQVTKQGLIALGWFLALVMLLIWVYFRDFKMSIAAILALAHDLIVTIGFFALLGFSFTPASLIGVLSILGYSLYDTVVVFDKIRENVADLKDTNVTYHDAASKSVNQVLVRSINTTIIGVLPVAALLIAGAVILKTGPLGDLGLSMFVGMIAGAYSSIFIATPLLAQMKEREPAWKAHHERIEKRAARKAREKAAEATLTDGAALSEAEANDLASADLGDFVRVQPKKISRSTRKASK